MAFETIFKMSKFWSFDGRKTRGGNQSATLFYSVDKKLGAIEGERDHNKIDGAFSKLEKFEKVASFKIEKNSLKTLLEMGHKKDRRIDTEKLSWKTYNRKKVKTWAITQRGQGVEFIPLDGGAEVGDFDLLTDIESEEFAIAVNQDLLRSVTKSISKYSPSQGEIHKNVCIEIRRQPDSEMDCIKMLYMERDHLVEIYIMPVIVEGLEKSIRQVARDAPQKAPEGPQRLEADIVSGWGVGIFRACVGGI